MKQMQWPILLVGILLAGAAWQIGPGSFAQDATKQEQADRGVLVVPPTELMTNTDGYMLNVEVKQIKAPEPSNPVTGVVEIRSLATEDTVKVGQFSIYPVMADSDQVHRFNFDLSSFKDAVSALGPRYEVEVVSVDALTGKPTNQPNFEIVGANLAARSRDIK